MHFQLNSEEVKDYSQPNYPCFVFDDVFMEEISHPNIEKNQHEGKCVQKISEQTVKNDMTDNFLFQENESYVGCIEMTEGCERQKKMKNFEGTQLRCQCKCNCLTKIDFPNKKQNRKKGRFCAENPSSTISQIELKKIKRNINCNMRYDLLKDLILEFNFKNNFQVVQLPIGNHRSFKYLQGYIEALNQKDERDPKQFLAFFCEHMFQRIIQRVQYRSQNHERTQKSEKKKKKIEKQALKYPQNYKMFLFQQMNNIKEGIEKLIQGKIKEGWQKIYRTNQTKNRTSHKNYESRIKLFSSADREERCDKEQKILSEGYEIPIR